MKVDRDSEDSGVLTYSTSQGTSSAGKDSRYEPGQSTLTPLQTRPSEAYRPVRKGFILALFLQLGILAYLGFFNMYVLAAGRPVILETVPVDPRDIFRGDYFALGYEIGSVATSDQFRPEETVFVTLQEGTPHWSACCVSKQMPNLKSNQVALKARVQGYWGNRLHLHYGLEQYFAPEGKAVLPMRKTPDVQIAVDQFGNSAIKKLIW
jgi:uncharacterized membrane-anchored protein